MGDLGESDKMIKISEKVDRLVTFNMFSNTSFFIHKTFPDKTFL